MDHFYSFDRLEAAPLRLLRGLLKPLTAIGASKVTKGAGEHLVDLLSGETSNEGVRDRGLVERVLAVAVAPGRFDEGGAGRRADRVERRIGRRVFARTLRGRVTSAL